MTDKKVNRLGKCAIRGCKTPIPKGRRKYCSADCQILAARKLTREWRKNRDSAHKREATSDIPAQIRRYRVKGGGEVYDYLQDDELISNRNPKGSRYAEQVINWVDRLWPGSAADSSPGPDHRILIVAPCDSDESKDTWAVIGKTCFRLGAALDKLGADVRILYSNSEDEIFTTVQDYRPTVLSLHSSTHAVEICSRIQQFRDDGMAITYAAHEDSVIVSQEFIRVMRSVDEFFFLIDDLIDHDVFVQEVYDGYINLWNDLARKHGWLA